MKEIESNFVANHVFLSTILLAMIYWIAAFRLPDGMEWQVDVPDEVDDELQRLDSVLAGRILVAQHAPEVLDAIHHAVLAALPRPFVRHRSETPRAEVKQPRYRATTQPQ